MDNFEKLNEKQLIAYFESGANDGQKLGLEVEHFVCGGGTQDGFTVPYLGERGVEQLLQKLLPLYERGQYSEGHLIGLSRKHCTVTIEPAAQLEASIGEFESIDDLLQEYQKFLDEANGVLSAWGQRLVTKGYNPHNCVSELSLIPKQRYRVMDAHFVSKGGTGVQMMRGSCATQVSLDYKDEKDFADKYLVANMLSPIFAFMFDNTDVYEKQKAGVLTRYKVWNNLEGDAGKSLRTGFVPQIFEERFGFSQYARYILGVQPLFVMDGETLRETGKQTVKQVYQNKAMTTQEVAHALSMVFPFVRLKKYIEIRMADSMPVDC
ncbi:MAG: glutamate-cysteine ligase family protein, partial [Firmicutes bacterium]|nr:glutamate-cysteine ligase family protein [Bacillota bacterium]